VLVPERLLELSVFVGAQELETVTTALMREAALHPDNPESEQWAPDPAWAEASETYGAILARLERVRGALGLAGAELPFDEVEPRPSHDRLDLEGDMLRIETRIGGWQEDHAGVRRELDRLEAASAQLETLRPLDAPLEELRRLSRYHLTIGTLPQDNVERVAGALFQVTFVLVPLERRGDRTLVAAAAAREDADVLDRALASAFFEPTELPLHVEGPPEAALASVREDLRATHVRLDELEKRRARLRDDLGAELQTATARARADVELCEAIRRFPFHGGIYVIAGWIPAARAGPVTERLRALAGGPVVVETVPPARGRPSVPSLVRNPPWLRPFEPLVATFGLAGYDELDPTLFAAIVFLFMYGMMFGDMGHGALLALAGLALRRVSPLGTVVAAAGASSTLFGALYGVAFGAEVMPALWLRPLHAIFPLLIAAVAAGAVILNLGFALNLISAARNRDAERFWLDKSGVLGVALYWSLLGGGLAVFAGRIPTSAWLGTVAVLSAVMWFREPLAERLAGRRASLGAHAVTGFFELFEAVIAYLSNSLSFVRLGAFAVAHEGLSSMVLRYAGGSSGWITLVLGTVLIVGFEGLIVGIQALRLQYYEFFGRFFQGRGTPFRALTFDGGTDA
jgi:V/A-type H+-transporting ATPase subunit I